MYSNNNSSPPAYETIETSRTQRNEQNEKGYRDFSRAHVWAREKSTLRHGNITFSTARFIPPALASLSNPPLPGSNLNSGLCL